MKKLLQLAALLTLTAFFLPVLTVGFPIRAAEAGEEGVSRSSRATTPARPSPSGRTGPSGR